MKESPQDVYALIKAKEFLKKIFSFEIPTRQLTPEESKVLETLFPNLEDAAHALLEKEALLGAIASHSEVMCEPQAIVANAMPMPVEEVRNWEDWPKKGKKELKLS